MGTFKSNNNFLNYNESHKIENIQDFLSDSFDPDELISVLKKNIYVPPNIIADIMCNIISEYRRHRDMMTNTNNQLQVLKKNMIRILEDGNNPNYIGKKSYSYPIDRAIEEECEELVEILIKYGAIIFPNIQTKNENIKQLIFKWRKENNVENILLGGGGSSYSQYDYSLYLVGNQDYESVKKSIKLLDLAVQNWPTESDTEAYASALSTLACFNMDEQYIPRNPKKALELWKRSADLGDGEALYSLGVAYQQGELVNCDINMSLKYYEEAAKKDNSSAMNNIASIYFNGIGVKKDYVTALKYYEMAAKNGLAYGKYMMGHMIASGLGVKQNLEEAAKILAEASNEGIYEAEVALQKINNYLYNKN